MERTRFVFDEVRTHLNEIEDRNHLIEDYFAQYILIVFYSEAEDIVKAIVEKKLLNIPDRKVAHFILKMKEGMIKRLKKTEINDVLKMFDCGEGDVLGQYVGEDKVRQYSALIVNRHAVAHRSGSKLTLSEIEKALPCAEEIFSKFDEILAAD